MSLEDSLHDSNLALQVQSVYVIITPAVFAAAFIAVQYCVFKGVSMGETIHSAASQAVQGLSIPF